MDKLPIYIKQQKQLPLLLLIKYTLNTYSFKEAISITKR